MLRTRAARIALAPAAVLFTAFVWPTPHAYDAVAGSTEAGLPRRRRLTNRVEGLSVSSNGWVPVGDRKEPDEVERLVLEAVGEGKEPRDPRASIPSRRLLTDPNVEARADELKSRIGADAYRLLIQHDELRERWAAVMR